MPAAVRIARATARAIITTWTAMSVWRLGRTSARTPANSPKIITGCTRAVATTPRPSGPTADVKDEPALRDLLHPRANERHCLTDEEQSIVPVSERGAGFP